MQIRRVGNAPPRKFKLHNFISSSTSYVGIFRPSWISVVASSAYQRGRKACKRGWLAPARNALPYNAAHPKIKAPTLTGKYSPYFAQSPRKSAKVYPAKNSKRGHPQPRTQDRFSLLDGKTVLGTRFGHPRNYIYRKKLRKDLVAKSLILWRDGNKLFRV